MKFSSIFAAIAIFSAPIQAQFCQFHSEVHACSTDAENRHNSCGGNPQCLCSASEAWALCYSRCPGEQNYLERLNFINGQIAQHCGRPGFVGGMGPFPSAIPGVIPGAVPVPGLAPGLAPGVIPGAMPGVMPGGVGFPGMPRQSFNSVTDNSMQFQATATFRSGNLNSQSFRNSATGIQAAPVIVSLVAIASVMFTQF